MRVRIRQTPLQAEIDGIELKRLRPGTVKDVPSNLASWLIVEGYAEPEMRSKPRPGDDAYARANDVGAILD